MFVKNEIFAFLLTFICFDSLTKKLGIVDCSGVIRENVFCLEILIYTKSKSSDDPGWLFGSIFPIRNWGHFDLSDHCVLYSIEFKTMTCAEKISKEKSMKSTRMSLKIINISLLFFRLRVCV